MKPALALGLLLALATSASAGVLRWSVDELRFVGKGEANRVTITDLGANGYEVVDRAGRMRVDRECFQESGRKAFCAPGDPNMDILVSLGGGADRLAAAIRPGNLRDEAAKGITARGGPGPDRLVAQNGTSADLRGEGGNDVLLGAPRLSSQLFNDLSGGGGEDLLVGRSSETTALGGPGDDEIRIRGGGLDHFARGGDGNDVITYFEGGGSINAGAGDDRLTSGPNLTYLRGDAGNDMHDAANSDATAVIACGAGTNDTVVMGPEDRFGFEGLMRESQDPADWGCENVTRR